MGKGRITALAARLESRGVEVHGLRELQQELDLIESPPGLVGRITTRARLRASRLWRPVVGELQESAEAMALVQRRVTTNQPLTRSEAETVRAQLLDLLRVVPAGLIAVVNYAVPVPFTSVFTPWLLARLGLMPSRWREAHVLASLDQEAKRLRAAGRVEEAADIEALESALEAEADAREAAAHAAELLTHWDKNGNGVWDPDEEAAYTAAVSELRGLARERAGQRRWFLSWEHQVFGPTRLEELLHATDTVPLLVCFDGQSGWVSLRDLVPPAAGAAPPP